MLNVLFKKILVGEEVLMNEMFYEGQDIGKRIFNPEHSSIVSVL